MNIRVQGCAFGFELLFFVSVTGVHRFSACVSTSWGGGAHVPRYYRLAPLCRLSRSFRFGIIARLCFL